MLDVETRSKMDEAAAQARLELAESVSMSSNVVDIAKWIRKHYLTAGYTRLCRILVEYAR
jgi:hypothetical protein